jgi:uncharacterized membrane protein YkgB
MITFQKLDRWFISGLHRWSIPLLRNALGVVFFWFGWLKLVGLSPAEGLVRSTFGFLPFDDFFFLLGIWEVAIGIGLWFKQSLRAVLALLWLQMAGTFLAVLLNPALFFVGIPFLLTLQGEFVVKNLVLVAASLVVAGYELKPAK